jgi:hypothetical protein
MHAQLPALSTAESKNLKNADIYTQGVSTLIPGPVGLTAKPLGRPSFAFRPWGQPAISGRCRGQQTALGESPRSHHPRGCRGTPVLGKEDRSSHPPTAKRAKVELVPSAASSKAKTARSFGKARDSDVRSVRGFTPFLRFGRQSQQRRPTWRLQSDGVT